MESFKDFVQTVSDRVTDFDSLRDLANCLGENYSSVHFDRKLNDPSVAAQNLLKQWAIKQKPTDPDILVNRLKAALKEMSKRHGLHHLITKHDSRLAPGVGMALNVVLQEEDIYGVCKCVPHSEMKTFAHIFLKAPTSIAVKGSLEIWSWYRQTHPKTTRQDVIDIFIEAFSTGYINSDSLQAIKGIMRAKNPKTFPIEPTQKLVTTGGRTCKLPNQQDWMAEIPDKQIFKQREPMKLESWRRTKAEEAIKRGRIRESKHRMQIQQLQESVDNLVMENKRLRDRHERFRQNELAEVLHRVDQTQQSERAFFSKRKISRRKRTSAKRQNSTKAQESEKGIRDLQPQKRSILDSQDEILPLSRKKRATVIKVLEGESREIQGPNSDVALCTPKGAHGMVFGTIHTNPQPFLHLIPELDCLIAPICEFSFQPRQEKHSPEGLFRLLIPHTVKDIEKVKGHIRVRHVTHSDEDKEENVSLIPKKFAENLQDRYWECNSTHVIVHTPDFCDIIVTAEGLNCCAQTAELLVFGSWVNLPKEKPRVDLNLFLGSTHTDIADYIVARKTAEEEVGSYLVRRREIPLTDGEEYNAGKSFMQVSVKPKNPLHWKAFNGMPLETMKGNFQQYLPYDGTQHICKKPPKQLEFFHLESGNLETTHFTGTVSVEVTTRGPFTELKVNQEQNNPKGESVRRTHPKRSEEPKVHTMVVDVDELKFAKYPKQEDPVGSVSPLAQRNELTASGLWSLATRVTSEVELLNLAIKGLKMSETHNVLSHISNHNNNINVAAYKVLEDWKKTQPDIVTAYRNITRALDRAKKPEWKSALQQ